MPQNFVIDYQAYFAEVAREHSDELDMNADPEVSHITDPAERRKKADQWLEARLNQFTRNQGYDMAKLDRACSIGYLPFGEDTKARQLCQSLYRGLSLHARLTYQKSLTSEPTNTR